MAAASTFFQGAPGASEGHPEGTSTPSANSALLLERKPVVTLMLPAWVQVMALLAVASALGPQHSTKPPSTIVGLPWICGLGHFSPSTGYVALVTLAPALAPTASQEIEPRPPQQHKCDTTTPSALGTIATPMTGARTCWPLRSAPSCQTPFTCCAPMVVSMCVSVFARACVAPCLHEMLRGALHF